MAAGTEMTGDAAVLEIESTVAVVEPSLSPKNTTPESAKNTENFDNSNSDGVKGLDSNSNGDLESKLDKLLKELKLNLLAKEFFPSSYHQAQMGAYTFVPFNKNMGNDDFPNNRREEITTTRVGGERMPELLGLKDLIVLGELSMFRISITISPRSSSLPYPAAMDRLLIVESVAIHTLVFALLL